VELSSPHWIQAARRFFETAMGGRTPQKGGNRDRYSGPPGDQNSETENMGWAEILTKLL
jgi:hypothetical protein